MVILAESIENAISSKVKAVIVVHMWGIPADCEAIRKICDKYHIFMIEDFSHAHYSKYKNKYVGSFGDISFCSLQRKKTLSVGEGGLITTNNSQLFKNLKEITSPGSFADQNNYSSVDFSGFGLNMRMSPFSAVVAKNLLPKIENILALRRYNLKNMIEIIKNSTDNIVLPPIPGYTSFDDISWYSYKPVIKNISIENLKPLKLWKFSEFGYSAIKDNKYWQKDINYFPFCNQIEPILRSELTGHKIYMQNRITLNIPSIEASYWSQENIEKWKGEIKLI